MPHLGPVKDHDAEESSNLIPTPVQSQSPAESPRLSLKLERYTEESSLPLAASSSHGRGLSDSLVSLVANDRRSVDRDPQDERASATTSPRSVDHDTGSAGSKNALSSSRVYGRRSRKQGNSSRTSTDLNAAKENSSTTSKSRNLGLEHSPSSLSSKHPENASKSLSPDLIAVERELGKHAFEDLLSMYRTVLSKRTI